MIVEWVGIVGCGLVELGSGASLPIFLLFKSRQVNKHGLDDMHVAFNVDSCTLISLATK